MLKDRALLSISFRPFFLLAALIAFINPNLWVVSYLGRLNLPLSLVDPLFWHAHEMLFGFTGALIAGFILTASANWTNSKPYQGWPLLILILFWLIERGSYFLISSTHLQFVFGNIFFPLLMIMLLVKLWNFKKQRNVFVTILFGLTISKTLHSYGYFYAKGEVEIMGREMAIALIRLIVLLIAGRILPFFSSKKIDEIKIQVPKWINAISLASLVTLVLPFSKGIEITLYLIAFLSNMTRQLYWKPHLTWRFPILFILHIGIFLINIELLLEVISFFNEQVHFTQASLHLLMSGGLGVIGVGIMSRVSLGHTGRVIRADLWTRLSYAFILIGSLIRVIVPIFYSDYFERSLHFASGFWTLGFLIFLIRYFLILVCKRPDGR
ncbi:NnrS family protein [Halobacteriovorax sp. GB3]|uniref:NnrS family protein n=1 Tax=Halobacteriovorax sp. GB3 TaxID=2719615 RepID=UPI00235F1EF6|nr:NnrS family protein [Halobacteriovorax sp. GB3]MDD0851638.1 NnrS family protein [Halobacteriovorax sp. GB3]